MTVKREANLTGKRSEIKKKVVAAASFIAAGVAGEI
jgi:hypothetical protein